MSFFINLYKFIKIKIWDIKNPLAIFPFGITCYVGLPGSGKTLSLVEKLNELRLKFPLATIATNFGYANENCQIKHWKDLIDISNPEGVIFGLDEVHDVFDRKDWNNMPKSVLRLFSQNRKVHKQLICTAQSFEDIVIDIRRRCHFIIECTTFARRWVFQRAFRLSEYKVVDGVFTPRNRAWRHSFVADNSYYDAYDTYKVIELVGLSDKVDTIQTTVHNIITKPI